MSIDMQTIYKGAAILGGGLLLVQVALALFGADGDADVDVDADGDVGHGSGISFRTVVAFVAFFGLGGWGAIEAGYPGWPSLAAAVVTGSAAFWLVGLMITQMYRLQSSGTIDIKNAVGAQAKVYLTVPAEKSGSGMVTVPIQGRTMEFKAVTAGRELKTGALCKVVGVVAVDTVEIEAV
jgi:ABC-type transport system involved in cytochrome c biogenesis permease subunit